VVESGCLLSSCSAIRTTPGSNPGLSVSLFVPLARRFYEDLPLSSRNGASIRCTAVLLACASVSLVSPASACTGAQFVVKRAQLHCDRKSTYADVEASPFAYVSRVLELRGTVGGSVTADGRLSVMLNMENGQAVMLDVPPLDAADVRELATPQIRALVEVKEGATGNVVPLKTLAVAYESAVAAEDRAEQARQEIARKKAGWKKHEQEQWQATMDRALHHRSVESTPARGEYVRPANLIGSGAPVAGLSARARPLYWAYYQFIARRNPRLNATQVGQITYHLLNFADRFNVDPRLVVAMIIAESDFDPTSTSRTGAQGLGQLMPGTARGLGVHNSYDIVQNLGGSITYLRSQLDTFSGNTQAGGSYSFEQVALAMAAYNAGENAVKKYRGVPPYRETQAYVKRVTSLYQQLCR
jgi:soluble lytic murein transglycosylase-like protein